MVGRLNRRDQFAHLRAHCTTVREGRLRISFVDPDCAIGPCGAAVAFAVPRKYGSAVRRNLLRRRLRELMREVHDRGELPRCWFLVSVMSSAKEPGYSDLRRWVNRALVPISEQTQQASERKRSDSAMSTGSKK